MMTTPTRRWGRSSPAVLAVIAMVATAISWIVIWEAIGWNAQIDLTGRRSFVLSPAGHEIVTTLEGPWEIVVLLPATGVDASNTQQVLQTLAAMGEASQSLQTSVIDPTSGGASTDVQRLLASLSLRYSDDIMAWDRAIARGIGTLEALIEFVRSRGDLGDAIETQGRPESARAIKALRMLGQQGDTLLAAIRETQVSSSEQPIPQYAKGRAIAVEAMRQWAAQLSVLAGAIVESSRDGVPQEPLALEAMAIQLNGVARDLASVDSPPLEGVGDLLTRGYGAIVMSPTEAMVVPGSMLFPAFLAERDGGVMMDRRFKGEHVLTGPLRVLRAGHRQTVVFVHGEAHSLLEPHDTQADVTAVAAMVHLAGYGVAEWIPGRTPRPEHPAGGVIWVIVPPLSSPGTAPDEGEHALLEAAASLLTTTSDPVLLTLRPSLLPRYGTVDPWANLLEGLPVEADTGVIVASQSPGGMSGATSVAAVTLHGGGGDPVGPGGPGGELFAQSIGGLRLVLPFPQPLAAGDGATALFEISPRQDRWFEGQWQRTLPAPSDVPHEAILAYPVPIVVGIEERDGEADRRIIVIGSASWLLGAIADLAIAHDGSDTVLLNPGNTQLLLSSLAWLTGDDDGIAQSAIAQHMDRLTGVTPGAEVMARWTLLVVLPGLWLVGGVVLRGRRG